MDYLRLRRDVNAKIASSPRVESKKPDWNKAFAQYFGNFTYCVGSAQRKPGIWACTHWRSTAEPGSPPLAARQQNQSEWLDDQPSH